VDFAFGILLNGREDDEIQDYFIESAFPPVNVMQDVLDILPRDTALTLDGIGAKLNRSRGMIERAIRLLDVDGAVRHDGSGYVRTAEPWEPEVERFNRVTQHRRDELSEMQRYVEHKGCLMEFLARALDDPAAGPCGKCMNCRQNTTRQSPPVALTCSATTFLRGDSPELKTRDRWPKPLVEEIHVAYPGAVELSEKGVLKTAIPERFANQAGRILCVWGDAGWGRTVAQGKYGDNGFDGTLIDAIATLILEKWKPEPSPEWITAVPSLERTTLVSDFAERLAKELGLPYLAAVRKVRATRPQKEMQNSVQQLRNLLGAFQVTGSVPSGPVLLVDDVTDSGWTMTLLGVLLQQHGSGPVFPLALAKASPRSI
jgi:ATP-dependent DNA helicase RecQ